MGRRFQRLFVLGLVPGLLALSLFPVLRPATDPAAPTDAVVVLSGDHGERLPVAMSLIDKGLTRTLVFAGTPDRAEEDDLCRSKGEVEYICLRPSPDNTRAEARAVSRLADARGWDNIVVVTSRFHVTRSRILFRRCVDAEVRMMAGDPAYSGSILARQIRLEWAKAVYTVASGPDC